MRTLPTTAKAVIIGGGIVGCSTAYHLARLGWTDTVLLERCKLTSGTTFHAAGLVGQLRTNANITQLLGYSVELYERLEAETGLPTGWKRNGGLRLACNPARWTEVRRQATTAHSFGLEMHLLTPREAQEMWPLMQVDDVIGAAFLPTDGQANPSDITQSLARGARMAGAAIFEDTPVTRIVVEDGRIAAVETPQGRIECAVVIACAGQWTRDLAATIGVNVPLVPVEHQYMVTEAINGVTGTLPTLRDPDRLTYYKEEVGGLVMGGYEPNPIPWAVDGIPEGFHYTLLDSNYDQFEQFMERAIGRVPAFETAGIKQLINGPESFTPDGNFILGEAPEQPGFFVGAGFNAFGIAAGGGAGMALAEWVAKGAAPFDLWPVDIRRFGRPHLDTDWVRARTLEAYGKHYTIAWPSEEHESGRPCRRSPLYAQLRDAGACFGEKLGWERPNWFADRAAGEEPVDRYSFERPGWFDAVRREHLACRNAAVLIDQSSFAKFIVKGPDAAAALNWICAGNVDRPVGRLAYTQMLNERGGIECDLTVAGWQPTNSTSSPEPVSPPMISTGSPQTCRTRRAPDRRCHLGPWRAVADGARGARDPAAGQPRRCLEWRLPLRSCPPDRHRRGPGSGAAGHLCRRVGLGVARPGRVHGQCLCGADGGGRRSGPRQCGLSRDRDPAAGKGLSRLGGRYRPRLHARGGGPRLGDEDEVGDRFPGSRRGRAPAAGGRHETARRLHRDRSRCGVAGARDDLSRWRACRLAGQRRLWPHARLRDRLWLCAQPRRCRCGLRAVGRV
jgi:glycine/D-amino acid oxidase-like deaminating enzyme